MPNATIFPSKEVCEGYQFGKAHRLAFGISLSRSRAPLECVHGDLFRPTRTASFSGNYMLVLIDDFSRLTWVYFIIYVQC